MPNVLDRIASGIQVNVHYLLNNIAYDIPEVHQVFGFGSANSRNLYYQYDIVRVHVIDPYFGSYFLLSRQKKSYHLLILQKTISFVLFCCWSTV